ncbi:MAG: DUF3971 domain-containing protein [Cereibacter sp.]
MLVAVVTLAAVALPGLLGRPFHLPVWAVAEVESRMNRLIGNALEPGASLALGGAAVAFGPGGVPQLELQDLRLINGAGRTIVMLPQLDARVDPGHLLKGEIRLRGLRIAGAQATLRRLSDGRFDLEFGADAAGPPPASLAELLQRIEHVFHLPALSALDRIEAEALTLTLDDRRADRLWQVGDGRVTIVNRPDELALALAFGLVGGGTAPAQAELTFISTKADSSARIRATVTGVAAADIASQAPALAWLGVLDAPISGRLSASLDRAGRLTGTEGTLDIGAGALHPNDSTLPVAFDRAGLSFDLDTQGEVLTLTSLSVESTSLRLTASGAIRVPGLAEGQPRAFISQMKIRDLRIDPAGLFEEPVVFSEGAVDARLRLDPFRIDIGQIALNEGNRRLQARGVALAESAGWNLSLDVALNEIRHDRLLALWPVGLVPKTRAWLVSNVQEGVLSNVKGGVRLRPGQEPRLSLGYDFAGAEVRFVRTLPPVRDAHGYSTILDSTHTTVLDRGGVTPPQGGRIDVAGSVIRVPDITQRPARAQITLKTKSSITAAMSLLDEPPFGFLTKADFPVSLAEGQAELTANLRFPLQPKVQAQDVVFDVTGTLGDVTSAGLVRGKTLRADRLLLKADNTGLRISGKARLGNAAFDGTWIQEFGPAFRGISRIEGEAEISDAALQEFGIRLQADSVTGKGTARLEMDIVNDGGTFRLESALAGVSLSVPSIGLAKGPNDSAAFTVEGRLGRPATIDRLRLTSGDVTVEGSATLRPDGGLALARFGTVKSGDWLDAQVELTGNGPGRDVGIAVTGGTADLRYLPEDSSGSSGGLPLTVALDRLTVTQGISLTGFQGVFSGGYGDGLRGDFTGSVNGKAQVSGSVLPTQDGTAARILSDDAGAVIAAAGISGRARGGKLDLTLWPRGAKGVYDGSAVVTDIRIRGAPILAEMLNAISVVGLLEQLNNSGLVFSTVEARFRTSPAGVAVTRGSAVGASLGVSLSGSFNSITGGVNMQGVISPIYLLNSIGTVLTRPGEGLFGFSYQLTGTADDPAVSVNPLSILTPGMFRDLFRAAPPGG